MARSIVKCALAAAIAAGISLAPGALTPTAHAQGFIRVSPATGAGADGQPPIASTHVRQYAELLDLNDEQMAAVLDMHQSFLNEHATATSLMQQKIDDARAVMEESGQMEVFIEGMNSARERYREVVDQARDRFYDDLRLLLTAEQETQWPAFERTRRRLENINKGVLSSETVDLVQLVDDLDPTPQARETVQPVLDAYETALDTAILERMAKYEALSERMAESQGPVDWMQYRSEYDAMREASVKVRNVNTTFARQIRDSLPQDLREKFEAEFQRRSFPQAYAGTYTERVVDSTLEFDDLTPEQRNQIEELKARLDREMDAANAKWAAAVRADEEAPDTDTIIAEQFGMPMEIRLGGEPEDLKNARAERAELAASYLDQVRALLRPEQQARLPRREPAQRGVGGGMRMMVLETTEDVDDAPPPPEGR